MTIQTFKQVLSTPQNVTNTDVFIFESGKYQQMVLCSILSSIYQEGYYQLLKLSVCSNS